MLAELHCHTNYSRGTKILHEGLHTPEQMVRHARRLGIGCLAITDHNKIEGALRAEKLSKKYGVIVIPGEEVTTRSGHLIALGISSEIPPMLSLDETLENIHAQGGIAIAPHAFDIEKKGLRHLAAGCDAIESFNALNVERIANRKNRRFAEKLGLPAVAGSDAHCMQMMGFGLTELAAGSADEVLKKIKKGDASVRGSYTPMKIIMEWGVTRLKLSYAYVINYMNENYSWPKRAVAMRMLSVVNKSPGNIDYLLRAMTYVSLGGVITYSAMREIIGV